MASYGLRVETDTWTETLADLGTVELRNIVAVVPGRSEDAIIIVAHRDNAGPDRPRGNNASGTAALAELVRGFGPQESQPAPMPARTLVFVSTDAGAFGGAGSARFARVSEYAENALAVVVLDGIGGSGRPRIALAGDRPASPARALLSTASARIAEQTGARAEIPSVLAQLVDLAIPFAAGEQGPFLAREIAAITITTQESGESGVPSGDPPGPIAEARLGELGRATEALIGSIDASVGAAFGTPDSLFFGERVASGWAFRLTLVVAVAPFVLGVVDLLARSRRRRIPFRPAARALRARLLFWAYAGFLLWMGAVVGVLPTGAALALPPSSEVVTDPRTAGVALLVIALLLGWLVGRRRLVPGGRPTLEERLAGTVVGLTWLAIVAVAVALTKPYALTFVLPSLYSWLWLPLLARRGGRAGVYAVGLAGACVGLLALGSQLGLNPLDTTYYVASLASVGYVSVWTVLLVLGWAASAAQLGAVAFGRYAPYAAGVEPPPPGAVRGTVAGVARRLRSRSYPSGT